MRAKKSVTLLVVAAACSYGVAASPAQAFPNPLKPLCSGAGLVSGAIGKACNLVRHGGRLLRAGGKLLSGHPGQALKTALGEGAGNLGPKATAAVGIAAVVAWVTGGARFVLRETSKVISETSAPQLNSTWFSGAYWRMTAIAALLALPFLFAAAIQSLIRSDLTLLLRAAFGYLPLAMLAVAIAAPVAMLLLAASDEMSSIISAAAGKESIHFLGAASRNLVGVAFVAASPFLAFLISLFTVASALFLWVELLMRAAAVYVIVLMLPLAFAALVWPARRVWAVRAVELLVALILSKFAIVAVLSLGGAALDHSLGHARMTAALAGLVLIILAGFAPWALLRMLPLAELASGAVGGLRGEARTVGSTLAVADGNARRADDWAAATMSQMRRDADEVSPPRRDHARDAASTHIERLGEDGDLEQSGARSGASAEPDAFDDREEVLVGTSRDGSTVLAAASDDASASPNQQRLTDLPEMYHDENFSWRPLTLGPDEDWSRPRVWPAEDPGAAEDDHDPTPPPQDPDEGRL